MKTRKIVLLAAAAFLALSLVIQIVASPAGTVKILALADKPDALLIEKGGAKIVLSQEAGRWVVGDKKYPADAGKVGSLVDALSSLKVYETLGGGDDDRFGLAEDTGLVVTAKKGTAEIRRVEVGKATSTSRQSYVRLDGKEDILLVSGNLAQEFAAGEGDLRDRSVIEADAAEATAVSVRGAADYDLVKDGDPSAWRPAGSAAASGVKVDPAKIDAWLAGVTELRAQSFAPEGPAPSGRPYGSVTVTLGSRDIVLTVLSKADDSKYLCSTSESPYLFYLSSYDVARCLKPLAELLAQ